MLSEAAQVRDLIESSVMSLRGQYDWLKSQGVALPDAVMRAVEDLTAEISALEKAIYHDQTELGQLRFLVQMSAMINSSFDVDAMLLKAMDVITDLTRAERGYIILQNQATGEFEFRVARESDVAPKQGGGAPGISQTIIREVLISGEPLLTDNAYQDERLQAGQSIAQMVLRSVLCVPLRYKGQIVGVVYVDNRLRAGVFTEREKRLLSAFANQMSIAMENARLFASIAETLNEIRQMKRLMDDVFASIGSGVVTTDPAHHITLFNRAAEQILGRESSAVIGQPLVGVMPNISADMNYHLAQIREDGTGQTLEAELQTPRHRLALSVKLSPLRGESGLALVLDDVTEKKVGEETLRIIRRYLPPEMVDNIHTISRLALGGEKREITCLFVEVRPLETLPAHYSPRAVMEHLNQYLSRATHSIHQYNGLIDKYMGNVVMALFNSQLNPMKDHARRAIEAALDLREAFIAFYEQQGINPDPHFYRVGIHTGEATLGNVGSLTRREFSAIGDTINLCKRLEENASSGQILISEATHQQLIAGGQPDHIRLIPSQPLQVKGRRQPAKVYEVFRA